MRDRSLSLFSFQFDIVFNLLFISTFLQILSNTPQQMNDYLRSYCFSLLDLCRKRNLKNIALTWVTLEKNNKLDTSHSFIDF